MAIHLKYHGDGTYYERARGDADHVAWPVDELGDIAHVICTTVIRLAVDGAPGLVIDATIVDLLRGAAPDAAPVPAAG